MSVGSIFGNSLSALQTATTALNVVSQNISNANTPGYVRAEANLVARDTGGVDVSSISRAANRFLAQAAWKAQASQGANEVRSELLDRAQAAFGDPNSEDTVFGSLNAAFSAMHTLSVNGNSAIDRNNAVTALQRLFSDIGGVGEQIESLRVEADQRLASTADQINSYLKEIAQRNVDVSRITASSGDATGAENARDAVLDQLAKLVDIRVQPVGAGMLEVRTAGGVLLARGEPATVSFEGAPSAYGAGGVLVANAGQSDEASLDASIADGTVKGLIQARDVDLPGLSEALGEFAAVLGDSLNEVHAGTSGAPPAASFDGRQTGLLAGDALNFSGKAAIGVVDSSGQLVRRLTLDFDAGVIRTEVGSAPATTSALGATVGSLATAINAALGADGAASFKDGVFSISGGSGVIFADDAKAPSDRAGRGFAQFFGLNDLVRSSAPLFYETGVNGSDAHGLNAGGGVQIRVRSAQGAVVADQLVAAAGTTWTDMVAALNDTTTGVGRYADASISADGRLQLIAKQGFTYEIVGDTTTRGATGVSLTSLFGIGRASTARRAQDLEVNATILGSPSRLGSGLPDLTAAMGARVVEAGDSRGAQALAAAKNQAFTFAPVSGLSGGAISLSQYASTLAQFASSKANAAGKAADGAGLVLQAASERRASVESVSVDDELLKMTQYQQSYSAAARLIKAASDMFDTLLNMV